MSEDLTHRVAVIAYLFRDDRFLLLHRNNPPLTWAPPGGRLLPEEDPERGIRREVAEETGLEIELLQPVEVWFGRHEGHSLLSVNFLARALPGEIRLSEEHRDYAWVSYAMLAAGKPIALDPMHGFQLGNFERAWQVLRDHRRKKSR